MESDLSAESIRDSLLTKVIGRKIIYLESVDSTNTYARKLSDEGIEEGALIITEEQTAGRGRQGRSWFTEPRRNLSFSIVLRPRQNVERLGLLSIISGIAVAEAIEHLTGLRPICKWPNDILFDGKKISGILCESVLRQNHVAAAIVGIGINVNQDQYPVELQMRATSLYLYTGKLYNRKDVLSHVVERIEYWYEQFQADHTAAIIAQWTSYAAMIGTSVTVHHHGSRLSGIAKRLETDGSLVLDIAGNEQQVYAGDVSLTYE